jgi:hypothetical protein
MRVTENRVQRLEAALGPAPAPRPIGRSICIWDDEGADPVPDGVAVVVHLPAELRERYGREEDD